MDQGIRGICFGTSAQGTGNIISSDCTKAHEIFIFSTWDYLIRVKEIVIMG